MSKTTVRELVTRWGFQVDDKPLKDMKNSVESLQNQMKLVVGAAVAVGGALFGIAKSTANAGDEAAKTARSLGLTAESLQELEFAASIGGVSQGQLSTGMLKLQRAAKEASDGVATYKDTFDELGITVKNQDGTLKGSEMLMGEIADRFEKMPDGTKKSALAMDLFGRSGGRLVNVLNGGSKGLRELRDEAQKSGFVISEADTVLSEEFNDSLNRLQSVVKGLKNQIGVGLLRPIKGIVDQMRAWILANRELLKQNLDKFVKVLISFLKSFVTVMKNIFNVVDGVAQAFGGWTKALNFVLQAMTAILALKFLGAIGSMAQGVLSLAKAWRFMGNTALLASLKAAIIPVAIGAAIALAVLAIEDLVAFFQGKDSVTGVIVEKFKEAFDFLGQKFNELGPIAKAAIGIVLTPLRAMITTIRTVADIISSVKKDGASGIFGALKRGVMNFSGAGGDGLAGAIGLGGVDLTPANAPSQSAGGSVVNKVDSSIEVNVPPGTSPEQVGPFVQEGIKDALGGVLRETSRATRPQVEF